MAIIKDALNGNVVNVFIEQAEHLRLLKRTHSAKRAGHKDSHAFFTAHGVLSSTARVARGGAQNVEFCIAPGQFVFKQVTQQLHGHVFESQSWAIGQSFKTDLSTSNRLGLQGLNGHNFGGAKAFFCVGLLAKFAQILGRNVIDVKRQNFKSQSGVAM